MPRAPRLFVEGLPSHAIVRGNNRQDVFRCDGDRIFFLQCLERKAREHGVDIHAYVLMSNHVHFLLTPGDEKALPRMIQGVGRHYVAYFNKRWERTGTLWEGRYRATLVEADTYLLACQRYIDMNPVRAGIVSGPEDYPWSSHRTYAAGRPDSLVRSHGIIQSLFGDPRGMRAAYRALFSEPLSAEIVDEIRHCTNQSWALGSPEFRAGLERSTGRRVTYIGSGRTPRKCV
jgi:putative transposase